MKNFRHDFLIFKNKLQQKENFAFSRFSDGEMYILQNRRLKLDNLTIQIDDRIQSGPYQSADFKSFDPQTDSIHQQRLVDAFCYNQANYYKGISCSCCVGKDNFDWQINLHGGDDESLTWANLWVNSNYPAFIQEILPLFYDRNCIFIGHKDANISNLPFIVKDFRVGYNAMINDYDKINIIKNWIKTNNIENNLFLFSASTFSNLAIYELFKEFPNNSYIDIGTCLAPLMNMPTERDYLQGFWSYNGSNSLNLTCIWN